MSEFNFDDPDADPLVPETGNRSGKTIALWLVAMSAAIVIVPLYLTSKMLSADNSRVSADVVNLQTSLAEYATPGTTAGELEATMTQVQAQINDLDPIYTNLVDTHLDWPAVMSVIASYDTAHVRITHLTQTDARIVISGRADSETAVMDYARMLEESGQFTRVVVQAITIHNTPNPTSTATSTPAPQPTSPLSSTAGNTTDPTVTLVPIASHTSAPTATPEYRDSYEPDDTTPVILMTGETQVRNFYPQGDIDRASIPVRAGSYYQVLTSDLGLGVDTRMSVDLNGLHWENDDYRLPGSGDFSSGVCFSALQDGNALVSIVNQAQQYSAGRVYKLSAIEIPGLVFSQTALSFGAVLGGASSPTTQSLTISGPNGATWVASKDSSWIMLNATQGSAPSTLVVGIDSTNLLSGIYQGTIQITWNTLCRQSIGVSLQVNPATSSVAGSHPRPARQFAPRADSQQGNTPVDFTILVEMKAQKP